MRVKDIVNKNRKRLKLLYVCSKCFTNTILKIADIYWVLVTVIDMSMIMAVAILNYQSFEIIWKINQKKTSGCKWYFLWRDVTSVTTTISNVTWPQLTDHEDPEGDKWINLGTKLSLKLYSNNSVRKVKTIWTFYSDVF